MRKPIDHLTKMPERKKYAIHKKHKTQREEANQSDAKQ
jgi:hypothetical protein